MKDNRTCIARTPDRLRGRIAALPHCRIAAALGLRGQADEREVGRAGAES